MVPCGAWATTGPASSASPTLRGSTSRPWWRLRTVPTWTATPSTTSIHEQTSDRVRVAARLSRRHAWTVAQTRGHSTWLDMTRIGSWGAVRSHHEGDDDAPRDHGNCDM